MSKPRLRFTGRDAFVALLGASSLLLFSHLYALRPALFLLPAPSNAPPPLPPTPPEGFSLSPPSPVHPGGPLGVTRMWVTPPGPGPAGVNPSSLVAHVPGWTVFTNLYLSNGTFFLVTPPGEDPETYWPERRMVTSTGLPGWHTNIAEREPTEREMDVMGLEEARGRWGERVWDVEGFSVLVNDPDQFLKHYYHVAAELLFGTERMLTNFDPSPSPDGHVTAPVPDRFIFMQCPEEGFSDGPRFNQFFLPAMWPSAVPMFKKTYDQFADLVSSPHKAYRFPTALFIDRSAAFRGTPTGSTARTPAGPWQLGGGEFGTGGLGRNQWWWESARRRVGRFAGVPDGVLDLGLRGWDLVRGEGLGEDVPVIMYISRQNARRRLIQEDHEKLVVALEDMCKRHGWILDVVQMEQLSREEQLRRAARTTVLIGVHGNGLTHQLLMPPHPYSTVIELFYPGGFARDYEWTAGALGKAYFGVNNDTVFAPPDLQRVDYPEGFQGNGIPVRAEVVVRTVEGRMGGKGGGGHWEGFPGVGY